jgi:predicted phosphohydrolase
MLFRNPRLIADITILPRKNDFISLSERLKMAIFVLSDLHLSTDLSENKSMEVFGDRWQDYMQKIRKNWNAVVGENDTVVVPGDISWATRLEKSRSDLAFLDSLNGKKLIGKGNHDFWWATASKMYKFFEENKFTSLSILYNNAYIVEDRIICGTRGWFPDESKQITVGEVDYEKIVKRETGRLKLSLDAAVAQRDKELCENGRALPIEVFLHFPPVWSDLVMQDMIDLLKQYEIKKVYFGHIHAAYSAPRTFEYENITFCLTSSDFLNFYPLKI